MIQIDHLSYAYGVHQVLHDINLTIHDNEVFTIIGPNGCGKSTLLKLISGIYGMDHSNILIQNKALSNYKRNELAKTISFLPQDRPIPPISVMQLVEHGRSPHLGLAGRLSDNDQTMIQDALAHAGISTEMAQTVLTDISGGERQRAYIAMLMAQDTGIMYLDEPTTYLDINYQFEILDMIQHLKSRQKTVIMVLHDIGLAFQYSDRIALMHEGRILFTGTPENVLHTGLLEEVFRIRCTTVTVDNTRHYLFTPLKG